MARDRQVNTRVNEQEEAFIETIQEAVGFETGSEAVRYAIFRTYQDVVRGIVEEGAEGEEPVNG